MRRQSSFQFRLFRFGCITIFFISGLIQHVYGNDICLNDQSLSRYADQLYKDGEYFRAITEYKRLRYFFPQSQFNKTAILQIGRCYMAGKMMNDAITYWEESLSTESDNSETYYRMKILMGLSLLDYDNTKPFGLRRQYIESAIGHFSDLPKNNTQFHDFHSFVKEWKTRPEPKYKSPLVAGGLSAVIPGTGSVYNGRAIEGIYAFFITGLFYWATLDAIHNDHRDLSVVFGFFTLAFYGGNIYAAVNGAHRLNDSMDSNALFEYRTQHGIWFFPETQERKGQF